MKKIITASLIALNALAYAADTGLNPNYLQMKVYRMAVSKSPFCTDPQVIFTNENPAYEDILSSPTLGTGSVANGSYQCVVLEISDFLKYAPDQNSDSGGCVLGQETVQDICRDGDATTSIEGITSNCQVGEDKVTLYISMINVDEKAPEGQKSEPFKAPVAGQTNYGAKLSKALLVAGPHTGTFIVNGAGKVQDHDWGDRHSCEIIAPDFSFR